MLLGCVKAVGICSQNAEIRSFSTYFEALYFLQSHTSAFTGLFMTVWTCDLNI